MMKYLNGMQDMKLTLSTENLWSIKWYVDMSFTVHPGFRSQTGGTMAFRKGAVQLLSKKQKLNARSSTEAELVGADDITTQILWTKHFMEAQGYMIKENITRVRVKRSTYQVLKKKQKMLDLHWVAGYFKKGHEATKADRKHR